MKITDKMLYEAAPEARDLWLKTTPQEREHTFSPAFEEQMQQLMEHPPRAKKPRRALARALTTAAAVVLACLLFAGTLNNTAFSSVLTDVYTVYQRVFRQQTVFHYATDLPPTDHLWDVSFAYLPEGFQEVSREEDEFGREIVFESEDGGYIRFDMDMVPDSGYLNVSIDTEDAEVSDITINGESAILVVKEREDGTITTMVQWGDKNFLFNIDSTISTKEVLEFARGISITE